jgi:hypothetical protein
MLHQLAAIVNVNVTSVGNCLWECYISSQLFSVCLWEWYTNSQLFMRMLHQLAAIVNVNVTSVGNCLWENVTSYFYKWEVWFMRMLHHISTSGSNCLC